MLDIFGGDLGSEAPGCWTGSQKYSWQYQATARYTLVNFVLLPEILFLLLRQCQKYFGE